MVICYPFTIPSKFVWSRRV